MTFGGERLLYPDVVCAIHATATECGIPRREVITNAGAPRTEDKSRDVARRLDEVDCVSIEPDGGVSICHDWTIGRVGEADVLDLMDRYAPYAIPEARAILEGGVGRLVKLAQGQGVEPDPGGYYAICDLCRSIRQAMNPRWEENTK